MPGELRVDTIKNTTGLGTISVGTGGLTVPNISGISSITSSTSASTIGFYNSSGSATDITVGSVNSGQLGGSRNIIINGSMVVNQRGWTGAAGTSTDAAYTTDRFRIDRSHDGVISAGQTSMNATVGGGAVADGFNNALILRVTTADSSLASGQFQLITHIIEGFNVQGIKKGTANALPVTLSFWVRSTTTGTYITELYDNDNTRSVSQAYTINAANTWEKKTVTFPADTTGVFDNDNLASLYVNWWLAAGSAYTSGTLQTTWATLTNANRTVGQVNALGTVGDFWLTGVQLEVGSVATPFERRSYGQELALCQRYYEVVADSTTYSNTFLLARADGSATALSPYSFKVTKRATPTMTAGGTVTVYGPGGTSTSVTSFSNLNTGTAGGRIQFTGMTSLTLNSCFHIDLGSGFLLTASSEF